MSFKSFYASDIHGSDMLWRKFINAASFYGVEALIMGGDIAGKAVIPIVRRNNSFYSPGFAGERAFTRRASQANELLLKMSCLLWRGAFAISASTHIA